MENTRFWGSLGGGALRAGMMSFSMGFGHFGTPGKGSRLHGSAFPDLLILLSSVGKSFLTENPIFRKDFRKREGI